MTRAIFRKLPRAGFHLSSKPLLMLILLPGITFPTPFPAHYFIQESFVSPPRSSSGCSHYHWAQRGRPWAQLVVPRRCHVVSLDPGGSQAGEAGAATRAHFEGRETEAPRGDGQAEEAALFP